jgi:hypothetical protein
MDKLYVKMDGLENYVISKDVKKIVIKMVSVIMVLVFATTVSVEDFVI